MVARSIGVQSDRESSGKPTRQRWGARHMAAGGQVCRHAERVPVWQEAWNSTAVRRTTGRWWPGQFRAAKLPWNSAFWAQGWGRVLVGILTLTVLTHCEAAGNSRSVPSSDNVPLAPSTEKAEHHAHCKAEMFKGILFMITELCVINGEFGAKGNTLINSRARIT